VGSVDPAFLADFPVAILTETSLTYASLKGATFEAGFEDSPKDKYGEIGTDIRKTAITRSDFWFANLDYANFRGASLYESQFNGASLQNVDFSNATLKSTDFNEADMRGSKFKNARFALLKDDELNEALKSGGDTLGGHVCSNCSGGSFIEADLRGADFEGAQVDQIVLTSADLRGANLKGLIGWRNIASLKGANVFGVQNAPDGFLEWAKAEMGAVSEQDDEKWGKLRGFPNGKAHLEEPFRRSIKYHPELHRQPD
jgi:uncharacterized protein YjbI with pentapeptide repeats